MTKIHFEILGNGRLGRVANETSGETWIPLVKDLSSPCLILKQANPFWFSPESLQSLNGIERKDEASFILSKGNLMWDLWIALPGSQHNSFFASRGDVLGIELKMDLSSSDLRDPVLFHASGLSPVALIKESITALKSVMPYFRLRTEKRRPDWLSGLGWCTWDAFYMNVDIRGIQSGLQSFASIDVPLRFLIVDDGWQEVHGWRLRDIKANEKFPGGLRAVVKMANEEGVPYVGVWHTLMGYWHGIDSEGPISRRYRIEPVEQTTTVFKGWPENHNPHIRYTIHPEDVSNFYMEFYQQLADAGISFTKVDGQSATPYFVGSSFPLAKSFTSYQAAFQGAASVFLKQGAIHCMANSPAILWRLGTGTVWRNSDDFFPDKPFSAQIDHIYNNLFNSLFTSEFAIPDWDMFQSNHPSAALHAATRALSGGPIYVSDKPGNHDVKVLKSLVNEFGDVPQFMRPARPVEKTILEDPRKQATPLMMFNDSGGLGQLLVVNCLYVPKPAPITFSWTVAEVMPCVHDRAPVIVFDAFSLRVFKVDQFEPIVEILFERGGMSVWTISPVLGAGFAPLGHIGIYASVAVVEECLLLGNHTVVVKYRHGGKMAAWCKTSPKVVRLGGHEIKFDYDSKKGLVFFDIASRTGGLATFVL